MERAHLYSVFDLSQLQEALLKLEDSVIEVDFAKGIAPPAAPPPKPEEYKTSIKYHQCGGPHMVRDCPNKSATPKGKGT